MCARIVPAPSSMISLRQMVSAAVLTCVLLFMLHSSSRRAIALAPMPFTVSGAYVISVRRGVNDVCGQLLGCDGSMCDDIVEDGKNQ